MKKPRAASQKLEVTTVAQQTSSTAEAAGYAEFEIDIAEILRVGLPSFFERLAPAPLTQAVVSSLPVGAKGAYLLINEDKVVYAGKTDTRHGFRERLGRHAESVQHRVDLDPSRMAFKAVRIMVFSAFDVEAILIGELRSKESGALPWNDSGFGSNDPGRRRDTQEPAKFDKWFPVDVAVPLDISGGEMVVAEVLRSAKSAVPYLLRFEDHNDLLGARIVLPTDSKPTMRTLLGEVINVLPAEWQATILHGRVILYREHIKYAFAREVLRR